MFMRSQIVVVMMCLFLSLSIQGRAEKKLYEIGDSRFEAELLDSGYMQELNQKIFLHKVLFNQYALNRDYVGMSAELQELAFVHLRIEDYDMALNYLSHAEELALEFIGGPEIAVIQRRKGTVYTEMGMIDKGLEFLFGALETLEEHKDTHCVDLTKAYKNIGLNYVWQGKYENCEEYFQKALDAAVECDYKKEIASGYSNLAGVQTYFEEYDSVLVYLYRAKDMFKELEDTLGLGTATNNIAEYYHQIGDYNKALKLYEEAYEYYCIANEEQFRLGTLKNFSTIYEKLGDNEKALQYSKEYAAANSLHLNMKLDKTVGNLDVSHTEIQKRRRIESELLLQNNKNKIKSYQIYLLSSLLLILIVVASLLVYNRAMKEKLVTIQLEKEKIEKSTLKEKIDFKDKELEDLALNITNKTRFLHDIKEKLNDINPKVENLPQKIRELKLFITQYLHSDQELADFNERVELLQQNFLFTLNDLFPELSENERQLCVLLRLGISSKDIALMRNVSEKSVHMARYRLRKKMQMESNENLVDYLKNI
jgi:tetratricopeptide (TPR) repeat protein/DNA-binding CsgD family transcriptional regulator